LALSYKKGYQNKLASGVKENIVSNDNNQNKKKERE